jgi:hypothetical protein
MGWFHERPWQQAEKPRRPTKNGSIQVGTILGIRGLRNLSVPFRLSPVVGGPQSSMGSHRWAVARKVSPTAAGKAIFGMVSVFASSRRTSSRNGSRPG